MVNRSAETSSLRCQVSSQRWDGLVIVARVIGELDGDRLGGALGNGAVQLLDGALSLDALVEPDEPDAFRQTCKNERR